MSKKSRSKRKKQRRGERPPGLPSEIESPAELVSNEVTWRRTPPLMDNDEQAWVERERAATQRERWT